MAVKGILDIDVNDSKFKQFLELFNKYQAQVDGLPDKWKKVSKSIDGSVQSFQELVAEKVQSLYQDELNEKAQQRAYELTHATEISEKKAEEFTRKRREQFHRLADDAKHFAVHIKDATFSLLKWTSITGVLSGLIGAGGLFGIERLGESAGAGRRSALGLGTTFGGQRAFGTNFSRLIDPGQFLSSVNEATHSIAGRTALYGAGLNDSQIHGNTTDVARQVLFGLKNIADHTPDSQMEETLKARNLDKFISLEDFERLKATSRGEINGLAGRFGNDQAAMHISDETLRKWQDFNRQMSAAGNRIEAVLIRGLVRLAPGLEHLSAGVTNLVESFAKSPALKKWIDMAGDGLERFAKFVGTPEFQQDVEDIATSIGRLAMSIVNALKLLGIIPNRAEAASADDATIAPRGRAGFLSRIQGRNAEIEYRRKHPNSFIAPPGGLPGPWRDGPDGGGDKLLDLVRKLEASGDNAVSPTGAIGRYQIEPGTAQEYGRDPSRLKDPVYNKETAKLILKDLVRRYHGNVDEILAAYNAGPGRADKFRASGDNPSVLPLETQGYLARAHHMRSHAERVKVEVNNNTGANVIATVNGMAH